MGWLRRLDMPARYGRSAPPWLTSVVVGLAVCAAALALRALLDLAMPGVAPFALLFPAMLLAVVLGRWQAGLTCFVAGGLFTWYLFLPARASLLGAGENLIALLVAYAIVGALMLLTAEAYRQAERRFLLERERRIAADSRRQRMLAAELSHRIKNILAMVQAIASQTIGKGDLATEHLQAFDERLAALGRAHDLLTQTAWSPASVADVVAAALAPFDQDGRISSSGPGVTLTPEQAVALSLGLHELATNAVKYGSLSAPEGRVVVDWVSAPGRLHLTWSETGGPPVKAPEARGFGSRLLQRALPQELGGEVRISYQPEGLRCTIDAQLGEVTGAEADSTGGTVRAPHRPPARFTGSRYAA